MDAKLSSVRALLKLGEKPKDISERTGVPYQKVLSVKKGMVSDDANRQVSEIASMDPVALDIIVEKAKTEAPARVVADLERVREGVSGLQKLDSEFHTTFSKILGRAEEFLDSDKLKPSEWVAITNALSSAYNNIFNNSGVSVNVDNSTKVSATSLSMFKGSLRG